MFSSSRGYGLELEFAHVDLAIAKRPARGRSSVGCYGSDWVFKMFHAVSVNLAAEFE